MVGTAFHRRPRTLVGCADPSAPRHHNTAASITNTTNPVREYVMTSITQSTMAKIQPTHRHLPRHPQQNGNSAQIAAAAWLGFANPNRILPPPLPYIPYAYYFVTSGFFSPGHVSRHRIHRLSFISQYKSIWCIGKNYYNITHYRRRPFKNNSP